MSNRSWGPTISALRRASETARGAIAEKCIRGMIRPAEDRQVYAWGQYLEIRGRSVQRSLGEQYGIYGTSAALQILTLQSGHQDVILRGSRVLPLILRDPGGNYSHLHERFVKKSDLIVTYKLCSLLDAANLIEPISRSLDLDIDRSKILEELLEIRHAEAGWPDYKSQDEWQGPNTHATAVALLSLSRGSLSAQTERACLEALRWFCDQPLEKQSIATLSMIVMALATLTREASRNSDIMVPRLLRLRQDCETLVHSWIKGNSPTEVQRSLEGTEYWLPPSSSIADTAGGARFTFLLYLPHVLAGLAVLASPRLEKHYDCRRYILGIIERVTDELNSQGCFIAAGRSMVSTVEHLWLYRLLHEFERRGLYSNSAKMLTDSLRYRITNRWPVAVLAMLLTVALGIAAVVTTGKLQLALGAVSAIILAIVATVFAAVIINRGEHV